VLKEHHSCVLLAKVVLWQQVELAAQPVQPVQVDIEFNVAEQVLAEIQTLVVHQVITVVQVISAVEI
jgi:hypothetical protein